MHDLNTINRLNEEAFAKSIATYRAQGKYVLVKYEGAHLVSVEPMTDFLLATKALDEALAAQHGGERNALYAPTPAFYAAARDQSEDRTLNEYINRKA